MAAGPAVKKQKEEAEAIAAALATGRDPTSIPVPWAHKYLQGRITLNQSLLAAINASIASPSTEVKLGPEHGSSHHAPWGEPGFRVSCLEAGRMALRAEMEIGLHGGREPWGYATMYGVCYSLAAAHPDSECREIGRRLLAGWLAVFYLLRGYEMGCRAEVTPEPNAVAILGLLAGGTPKLSRFDWHAAARVFKMLMPVLHLPWITSDDEAAGVIRDSGVRCLLGWEWLDYGSGSFVATILNPAGCVKTGTGEGIRAYFNGHSARPATEIPISNHRRALQLDSSGLSLEGDWSLPEPAEPKSSPEEPIPNQPTPEEVERARSIIKEVREMLKGDPRSRAARRRLHDALIALREEKAPGG